MTTSLFVKRAAARGAGSLPQPTPLPTSPSPTPITATQPTAPVTGTREINLIQSASLVTGR